MKIIKVIAKDARLFSHQILNSPNNYSTSYFRSAFPYRYKFINCFYDDEQWNDKIDLFVSKSLVYAPSFAYHHVFLRASLSRINCIK